MSDWWLSSPAGRRAAAQIENDVEAARETLVALLAELVAAPSENPPGDVSGVAAVLEAFLGSRGLSCESIGRAASKPNLVSTVAGRSAGPHLVLNGHMDTIPAGDAGQWTVPIHALTRRDGRLCGIGTGNMKAAVAALAFAHAWLARNADRWPGRISFTAVADETVFGPDGAGFLLEQRPDLLGDALICGEGPGNMDLAIAEKGVCWLAVETRCPAGQGMLMRRGASAVVKLARILTELDAMNEETVAPPAEVASLAADPGAPGLRVSINPGTISGGHFVSQVASRAVAEVDIRLPPGLTVDEVERRVAALAEGLDDAAVTRIKGWDPSWTAEGALIVGSVAAAAAVVRGSPPRPVVRLPASDATRWRARGVPAVCYGPQPLLASGVDDFVHEQDLVDCAKVYALSALAYLNSHQPGAMR